METIGEGKAKLVGAKPDDVFYNPIQQFNRDISVMAIRAWEKSYKRRKEEPYVKIIEGLAATGLRSCRYALEIPKVKTVVANDLSDAAVKEINLNAEHNGVSEIVIGRQGDANEALRAEKGHVIDLDPYGSAVPFLDAAVQSAFDGGLLLVTCTDLAVLAGNVYPEKCFSQYGGTTVRNDAVHESALRLVLNAVSTSAARYGRAIEPLLSLSIDYYVRCFIRIRTSKQQVKENLGKSMIVYSCPGCHSTYPQPLGVTKPKFGYAKGPVIGTHCNFCGTIHHIAGPMWGDRIHSREFIKDLQSVCDESDPEVYKTIPRIKGMTELALTELEDVPFYISPANMGSIVRTPSVPPIDVFTSALFNGGYEVSLTHAKPGCIKTNAPYDYLWDLYRIWVKKHLEKEREMKQSPGARILATAPSHDVSFEFNEKARNIKNLRDSKIVKFQENPREDWGPQARAKKKQKLEHEEESK